MTVCKYGGTDLDHSQWLSVLVPVTSPSRKQNAWVTASSIRSGSCHATCCLGGYRSLSYTSATQWLWQQHHHLSVLQKAALNKTITGCDASLATLAAGGLYFSPNATGSASTLCAPACNSSLTSYRSGIVSACGQSAVIHPSLANTFLGQLFQDYYTLVCSKDPHSGAFCSGGCPNTACAIPTLELTGTFRYKSFYGISTPVYPTRRTSQDIQSPVSVRRVKYRITRSCNSPHFLDITAS